jgi:signal peptide peptidase SppA
MNVPFSLELLWAMEPAAFVKLHDLVTNSSHERLAAAVAQPAGITSPDTPYENSGGVAVIPFKGVVAKNDTIWSQIFGGSAVTSSLVKAADAARMDPAVKSALLVIDSPGGTVDGTSDAADAIAALNAVKPVTAYADGNMSSAAYWIGSQAGRLVGSTTAHVGSIGVFSTIPDFSRMAKNAGIDVNVIKSASAKGIGTPGAPVTEDQLAEVQRLVDATHQLFVSAVGRGRGKSMADVADGRVHIGQSAVENGLLDAVEPLSTTLSRMQQEAKMPDPTPVPVPVAPVIPAPAPTPAVDYSKDIADFKARFAAQDMELAKLRAEKVDSETGALISQAITDRKLTPALAETAKNVAKHGGIDGLNAFLASLPATTAPAGGSVQEKVDPKMPDAPHPADHVGSSLAAYKADKGPAHQLAIAYMDKASAAGRKVTYYEAVVAVTRKG